MANTSIYAAFERLWQHVIAKLGDKANIDHDHDDVYYTQTQVDTALETKANTEHSHDELYYTEAEIDEKLEAIPEPSFIVTIKTNSDGSYSADKTFAEISGAYESGQVVSCIMPNLVNASLILYAENQIIAFQASLNGDTTIDGAVIMIMADDTISVNEIQHKIGKTDSLVVGSNIVDAINQVNTSITNITNGDVVVAEAEHAVSADTATSATSATKAAQDASDNVITSTYETKADASAKLTEAKTYTDTVAATKAGSDHNHDSAYDAKGAASSALASAKTYADSVSLAAANNVKNDLLNGAGSAYDTLKELGDLIDVNVDAIDALETVAAGKADKTHSHIISDVDGLQSALDSKAESSHGTHVSYSTTAPVMDGTASVGSATTVSRSDHRHPVDTSRASKTEFDTHVSDTTKHITSTERTNWGTAYTHSQAAHAPSDAEKNQNAFSNITVGSTTVAADTTTDTITFVGSNITITPDSTNDKITFTVADGTTSAKGIVKLTDSTSSTSTTTAATPNSVKSAYDLANTAKAAAATAQSTADGKANASHTHTVANISDLTATATELNYMDGVTSNVQTQLDAKASSNHTHNYAGSSSAGGAATTALACTGNSATASALAAARTINGVSFDGSANITIPASFGITTAGTGAAYTATVSGITALTTGISFIMIPHTVSTSTAPTLNVNSLGAKNIRRRVSNATTSTSTGYAAAWLAANKPIRVEYDGTYWIADLPKPSAADMSGTLPVKNGGIGKTSVTANSFLVGNGTSAMVEKTPTEVLSLINGVSADEVPTTLPNPYTLTINGTSYNGSESVEITINDDTETKSVLSDNLFDKSMAVQGQNWYHSSSGPSLVTADNSFYAYVPLRGAGTYRTILWVTHHGSTYALRVPILKSDNSFLQNVTGTLTAIDSDFSYLEFTITEDMVSSGAAVYAYGGMADSDPEYCGLERLMVVKDREYPSDYIPYGYIEVAVESAKKQKNVLCEKIAVFLGTSICAATTVEGDYYGYGWAGLIGEANNMNWTNYGKNGGTVTELSAVQSSRWLTTQADTALSEHPAADYVIFEGGCNDADQMQDTLLGEISSDYATFDTTTFSGAFESLVLQLVTSFPTAKIGYIIPQKMYVQNDHTATGHVHRRFFDRAIEICEKWGIPYVDLWKGNPLNPKLSTASTFYTDGQHLTLAGYERITPQIEAFMRSL